MTYCYCDECDGARRRKDGTCTRCDLPENPLLSPGHQWLPPTSDILTEREKEVLQLAANDFTSGSMGDWLGISLRTVYFHRANILIKLGVGHMDAAIAWGFRNGVLT